MKLVTFGPEKLDLPIERATEIMFGRPTLERLHGPGVKVSDWKFNQREIKFHVNVDNVPNEIRRFFGGSKLRVTNRQHMEKESDDGMKGIVVKNRIRMHFLGAELFKVKPVFKLTPETSSSCFMSAAVEHHAVLPPPLNSIAEHFMSLQTARELDVYRRVIRELVNPIE